VFVGGGGGGGGGGGCVCPNMSDMSCVHICVIHIYIQQIVQLSSIQGP